MSAYQRIITGPPPEVGWTSAHNEERKKKKKDPYLIQLFLGSTRVSPKRHLDWFSQLRTVHPFDQHTDRNTDHTTCDICSSRPHLNSSVHAMRPNCNSSRWNDLAWLRYHDVEEATQPVGFPFVTKSATAV